MRKKMSQNNIFPNFSVEKEYKKMNNLFVEEKVFGIVDPTGSVRSRANESYYSCLKTFFLEWQLRGTFTSVEEMMESLEITEKDFLEDATEERLLDFVQFVLNAIIFVEGIIESRKYRIYKAIGSVNKAIVDNCILTTDHLGGAVRQENGEFFITYKNEIATAIINQNKDIEQSVIEYLKIDNKGDIKRKGEVLFTLGKKLESYKNIIKGTEVFPMFSDAQFLLNNVGIRHYQNPDDHVHVKFMALEKEELEKWYDNTFQLIIACIAAVPYMEIKRAIKEIKK